MTLLAGFDLPVRVIREQITSAVDLIVQQTRLRDGSRKVVSVTEVQGMEGDIIVLNELFRFKETGVDQESRVVGDFTPTGMRPLFEPRLKAAGFELPPEMFGADTIGLRTAASRRGR
jgi:pilus assembly protein CpaF